MDKDTTGMATTEFYTAHECLLLDYEQALTRLDSTSGLFYDCSAHFVWCGERTRQLDKAHVEFLRGVANPIGVKMSNKSNPQDLVTLCNTLNPENTPGRLSVIIRMGAKNVREYLPKLIQAVTDAGLVVTWVCDPVHGNTETVNGYKTRRYDNIRAEVEAFFDVHAQMGTVPGGVHLEMTGDDVTECIGGAPLLPCSCTFERTLPGASVPSNAHIYPFARSALLIALPGPQRSADLCVPAVHDNAEDPSPCTWLQAAPP